MLGGKLAAGRRLALAFSGWLIACGVGDSVRDADRSPAADSGGREDAGVFEQERRIVAGVVSAMASETPTRAIGVVLIDDAGPRFHVFGPRNADRAPLDPDTTFEIGSVSKVFAGVRLADAAHRGEVALDDPIASYLPDWTLPSRDGRVLTLRDAATHFTGLPLMPANWLKTARGRTRYTEARLRENLGSGVLESAPGERFTYGNLNTALIGLALARRTERAYSALLHERVFGPLGMNRSGYPDVAYRLDDNTLDGYEDDENRSVPRIDGSPLGPCCVVRSTLRDMARFTAAALGAPSPRARAFADVATPQRSIAPDDPDSRWIGLGWELDSRLGLVRKSGQVAGYRCELVLQPARRRGSFVLVNSMRAKILGVSDGLIRALWDPKPLGADHALAAARIDRLPDTAVPARATFAESIALEGWEAPERAAAGDTLELTLYWRALRPIDDDYRVFVHGEPPASGAERASGDHYVRAAGATSSTRDWQPGMLLRDRFQLQIPATFPPGELALWLGWYRATVRLTAASAEREVEGTRLRGPSIAIAR